MQSNDDALTETEREHFDQTVTWDASRVEQLETSARRAWRVAGAAALLAAVAVTGATVVAAQHDVEVIVYSSDPTTGAPRLLTRLSEVDFTGDEAAAKYWIGRYMDARETYDWHTLQADYDAVGLMSSPSVGADYAALFTGTDALHEKWGQSVRATVDVASVVPQGSSSATVRFTKTTTRRNRTPDVTHWIATLAYRFDTDATMTEQQRQVNPYGFRVTSYRVDPELVGGGA